jgi:hypothetical protein
MKKPVILFLLILLISSASIAQSKKGQTSYGPGSRLFNAGAAFGLIGYGYGANYRGLFPVTANVEFSLNDKIALGPYVGFFSRRYNFTTDARLTVMSFGGRGTIHASGLINELVDGNIDGEVLDIYVTLIAGFEVIDWKYDGSSTGSYNNNVGFIVGPTVGIRYYLKPKIGLFLEGGRGAFGFATLGLSAKF